MASKLAVVDNHVRTLEFACPYAPQPQSLKDLLARSQPKFNARFSSARPFPKDPWAHDYVVRPGKDRPMIFSCGPDGRPDTADDTQGRSPPREDRVPFDPEVYLLDGHPVSKVLDTLASSTENERGLAPFQLWRAYNGSIHSCRDSGEGEAADDAYYRRQARLRREATQGRISASAEVIVPALTKALDDTSAEVRCSAAQFLWAIGPESLSACDKLRKRLSDTRPKVTLYAAGALYEIRREIKQPLDVCVRMLRHDDPEIRIIASSVLGGMHEDARQALPALKALLKDPDERVSMWAERHIEQIRKGR